MSDLYANLPPVGQWVPYPLPWVEGRCQPVSSMRPTEDGEWEKIWKYPEPDPEDSQGNNGPLKRIDPNEVMQGLRDLVNTGILSEKYNGLLTDAATLLYLLGD